MIFDCDPPILVAALYRFTPLHDHELLRQPLLIRLKDCDCRGTLLLASEGINGTIAGPPNQLRQFIDDLRSWQLDPAMQTDSFNPTTSGILRHPFADLEVKWSGCDWMPFRRARVRLKREIVTLGVDGIDPNRSVGTYISPEQWNEVIRDPEVVVIDTRNDYEVEIGTFEGAINPNTESFREFPEFVREHLDPTRHKKVAMFCTGGIRCEKSTAYLKQCGFEDVVHLRGGILKYLETVPSEQSLWQGECFVFDERVSVGHGLAVGSHRLCHGCGWPITEAMMNDPTFEKGVACPRCADAVTDDQRNRRRERQRQIDQQESIQSRDC